MTHSKIVITMCLLICVSCAASSIAPERIQPLVGTWQTDQDITVEIGPAEDNGFIATIVLAPGFISGGNSPGSVIMTDIRAQADGTFTGMFQVPDAKPVSVRMGFTSQDNLMIVTYDNRRRGGTMIWHRIRDTQAPSP